MKVYRNTSHNRVYTVHLRPRKIDQNIPSGQMTMSHKPKKSETWIKTTSGDSTTKQPFGVTDRRFGPRYIQQQYCTCSTTRSTIQEAHLTGQFRSEELEFGFFATKVMKFLEDVLNIGKLFCSQTVWLKLGVLTVVTVIVKKKAGIRWEVADRICGCAFFVVILVLLADMRWSWTGVAW